MKHLQSILLLLHLMSLFLLHPTSAVETTSSAPTPTTDPADFIRRSCATTLYPQLCYSSLSRFAYSVQSNPTRLAMAAIGVSLTNAKRTVTSLASLPKQADPKVRGVLLDCSSNFEDAVDEISHSLDQMKTLGSGTGSVRFQLSNVQTWMSAALTDAGTCMDGFQDVQDGPITEVVKRAEMVEKMTSNALVIVNSLANNGKPP